MSDFDPNGLDASAPGAKLDAGKPRAGLVLGGFAEALEEVAKVGTYGAQKYSPDGWLQVQDGTARYSDAMMRHWLASHREGYDQESGILHVAHVAWNALAVLQLILMKNAANQRRCERLRERIAGNLIG